MPWIATNCAQILQVVSSLHIFRPKFIVHDIILDNHQTYADQSMKMGGAHSPFLFQCMPRLFSGACSFPLT